MIHGKVVISGPDQSLKDVIADGIFASLKARGVPAICIDPYVPSNNDHIVGDTFVVCIDRGKLP